MLRRGVRLFLALALIMALALIIPAALAHGSMQDPISRIYACYLEGPESPDTLPCRDAIAAGGTQPLYDWNEVHILNAAGNHRALIPDGQLCSAGTAKYAAFDQPRTDWATTILPSSGEYTFLYSAYVPHNHGYFELYVTRDGYDPLQPLKWSDLEDTPFLRFDEPTIVNGSYVMTGQLPSGKSGRHLIYTIWQRTDSPEAFYACSDVWFGSSPTPTPTAPPACAAPAWSSALVYQAEDHVSYDSRDWRAKWSNSGQAPSSTQTGNAWEIYAYCTPGGATSTPTSVTPTATSTPTSATPAATSTPTSATLTPTPTRTSTPTSVTPTATATATATPTAGTPTGTSCQVAYVIQNQWGDGFIANVTISNSSAALSGWTLAWTFPGNQQISNAWNTSLSQSGAQVSAQNAAWNGAIASGGSTSLGFQASYSGTNSKPASFTLNGASCTVLP